MGSLALVAKLSVLEGPPDPSRRGSVRTQCSATVRWWERQWTSSVSRGTGAGLQPRPAGGTSTECREGGGL